MELTGGHLISNDSFTHGCITTCRFKTRLPLCSALTDFTPHPAYPPTPCQGHEGSCRVVVFPPRVTAPAAVYAAAPPLQKRALLHPPCSFMWERQHSSCHSQQLHLEDVDTQTRQERPLDFSSYRVKRRATACAAMAALLKVRRRSFSRNTCRKLPVDGVGQLIRAFLPFPAHFH